MKEAYYPTLKLSTWNIAANNQASRIGGIVEYIASQSPGLIVLSELTAVRGLQKALTRELGNAYSLAAIASGSRYGDDIGLLVTDPESQILDEVEPVPTHGDKMPYMLRAHLLTPLGEVNLLAMRGAYISGKGTLFSFGSAERKAQYQLAADSVKDRDGLSFIGGDMNSFARTHDPIFRRNGFHRLTGNSATWPDRKGNKQTTLDSRIMSIPFVLAHLGPSIDAIYGDSGAVVIDHDAVATGLSDHMFVSTEVAKAT